MGKPRVIAFYLPQFHPIPENDEWWGKGFTEWTNVGKAKPLFPGHYQPRVPADLGYYDLRVPEVREQQAALAKEAGIEGFCYYHYWFGNKNTPKELMQMPFNEVVRTRKPNFPFCLCWANHSFEKRDWDSRISVFNKTVLVEQKYYGIEDYTEHFYSLLPAFKDSRYIQIDGKNLFVIYNVEGIPDFEEFKKCWNYLAKANNLPDFYFVGYYNCTKKDYIDITTAPYSFCDSNIVSMLSKLTLDSKKDFFFRKMKKLLAKALKFPAFKYDFRKIKYCLVPNEFLSKKLIPEIVVGFDHSPRTGKMRLILHKFTPKLFEEHIRDIFQYGKNSKKNNNIYFLKSWNEWGEGNYIEPDLKFGKQFLEALQKEIELY